MERKKNAHVVVVGKPEGKETLGEIEALICLLKGL
jgi:hypothetical protein